MSEKTVLVTGATSGIGHATATAFLEAGWTVYAGEREEGDAADLGAAGARPVRVDHTDQVSCTTAVDRIIEETGRIDCLVNNAGYVQYGPLEDVSADRLHRQFDVNTYGPHRLTRLVLPHMREAGEGRIVTVSSAAALIAAPGYGAYAASKAAVEAMADALRPEIHKFGVEYVLVEPGPVTTEFQRRGVDQLRHLPRTEGYETIYEFLADRMETNDLGAVEPEAVAAAILDAATCSNPDPRIQVGPVARLARIARWLPGRWRDRGFRVLGRLLS